MYCLIALFSKNGSFVSAYVKKRKSFSIVLTTTHCMKSAWLAELMLLTSTLLMGALQATSATQTGQYYYCNSFCLCLRVLNSTQTTRYTAMKLIMIDHHPRVSVVKGLVLPW